jgi:hypothetical protein
MFKTGLKIFVVVASLSAIVLGYYYFFQRNKNVPDTFGIFIKDGPLLRINKSVKFWDALDRNGFLKKMDSTWVSSFGSLQQVQEQGSVKQIFVSPRLVENSISMAILFECYSTSHGFNVVDYIHDSVFQNLKIVSKEKSNYDYFAVYEGETPSFYFANLDGIVALTFSDIALMDILSKITDNKPVKPHKVFNTANDEVLANLFFERKISEEQSKTFLFSFLKNPFGQPSRFVYDIYLKDGTLLMSGLSMPQKGSIEEDLTKASSRPFELAEIIPEKIESLYQLSADGLVTQFIRKNLITDKQNLWLSSFTVDEYSFFVSDDLAGVGIKSKGRSNAVEALRSYDKVVGKSLDFQTYKFDNETAFDITSGDFTWLENILPGFFNQNQKLKYAVAVGDYVVFANHIDQIKHICRNSVLNRNLKDGYRFEQHKNQLSSASNTLFYADFNEENLKGSVSTELNQFLISNGFYELFETIAAQTSGSGNHLYDQVVFFGQSGRLQKSNVNWKTKLSASASLKPVITKNHSNSDDEIFVQDDNNYVYLISRKGRVLWQKMIDGPVISDVYQVDKYKNRKLQYLFNTAGKVYLIDRNGNDVERFPIALPVKASAGLSVFDYEENKNYRVFLPLKDKRVRLYDLDANLVSGWEFDKADAPVTAAIQHYRFDAKDYLVFGDTLRMYILNRRGETRIKPEKLVGKSSKNQIYFDAKKARWVSTTPKGHVFSVNIAGEVDILHEIRFAPDHFFMMADLTRNGQQDYIFINKNKLTVLDHKFKESFTFEFPNNIIEPPAYYLFSRQKAGIGIVDKVDGKVYMFQRDGNQLAGFPYPGITPFTISIIRGYLGFQLIVGNMDGFLYDYQLN